MLALQSVGEVIFKLGNAIVMKSEKAILKRTEPKNVQTKSSVLLLSFMIVFLLVCGLVQNLRSSLTFVESVYLWFITFTTIGFGDYLPNPTTRSILRLSKNGSETQGESFDTEKSPATKIAGFLAVLALLLGLCFVSAVLNSIIAVVEERKCRPWYTGCIRPQTEENEITSPEECDTDVRCMEMENRVFHEGNISSPP